MLGSDRGSNAEQIVEADLTGQLGYYGLVSPWAHEGVVFNAGAEYRSESLRFSPGAIERSGELSGSGVDYVDLDKGVSVGEGFAEMRVPIAQDRPLIQGLTVAAGYRYARARLARGLPAHGRFRGPVRQWPGSRCRC